jgi:Icc-related predicted phosphoesterase
MLLHYECFKMANLNILVLSDLHVSVNPEDINDTKLIINDTNNIYGDSIIDYIKNLDKSIDLLVCSGDIGNKGCFKSFEAGWSYINRVASELSINEVLCVPGNHDHQSRPASGMNKLGFSPKHQLQFSKPPFPFQSFEKNTHFWAWNWATYNTDSYNSICLNSSAYHGYGDEFKHGRIAVEVSDQIKNHLKSAQIEPKPINLLICHHHPEKMEHVDNDYDHEQMEGAQYLLSALEDADIGPWLIIHGHKHYATLGYASSQTSTPPTILSAGSLSAVLYDGIKDRTSNQFYILSVDLEQTEFNGKAVGVFETHEANKLNHWQPSTSNNLPASGGFGSLHTPQQILNYIKSVLSESSPFIEGAELNPLKEKMKSLTPAEVVLLERLFEKNKVSINKCQNKEIIEVGLINE